MKLFLDASQYGFKLKIWPIYTQNKVISIQTFYEVKKARFSQIGELFDRVETYCRRI